MGFWSPTRPRLAHLGAALLLSTSCWWHKTVLVDVANATDQTVHVRIRYYGSVGPESTSVAPGETTTVDGLELDTACSLPLRELPEQIDGISVTYPNGDILVVDREDLERNTEFPNAWIYELKAPLVAKNAPR